ncbi:MAG: CoA pyrophosphatase [Legionella sp.]|nr:CoA pyrophosphatase [Legionella sp.]
MDLNEFENRPLIQAAVIVLYERASDSLILTKRSEHLRAHPGEISFSGGSWEEGDENLYATALRELNEEVGISVDRVTLIRELKTEQTLLGSIIHPWFASIESINPYHLNPDEVTRIIAVPMSLVQSARNYQDIFVERRGFRFKTCEFIFKDDWIWGATARIMRQLSRRPERSEGPP